MKYLLVAVLSFNTFAFWDSELSDDVDRFIFEETRYLCSNYKEIKSISVSEVIDFPQGQTYNINYLTKENTLSGEMVISKTMWGDLFNNDLTCPLI
jgi:ADP-ribose pyrophosphatase YjhB (NUDIX family)